MTANSGYSLTEVTVEAVLGDPDAWRETLWKQKSSLGSMALEDQTRIVRQFLNASVLEGPGSIGRGNVRNILETILFLLENKHIAPQSVIAFSELLGQVLRREDLDQKLPVVSDLRKFLLSGLASTPAVNDPGQPHELSNDPKLSGLPAELAALIDRSDDKTTADVEILSRHWLQRGRPSSDPSARTRIDLFLLRAAITSRVPIAVEFIHELYMNDDFWASREARDWCSNIGVPVRPDGIGPACAAMINSRLRTIAPRTFLKHPDALVIDAIARTNEVDRIETGLREEFAVQIMSAIFRLDEALKPKSPVKGPLQKMRESLENTLVRYATRLIGELDEVVPYDPDIHLSTHPIVKGENVVVVQRGLRSTDTGFVIQPIKVVPESSPTEEKVKEQ